jgi:polyvinyl alcohol dehydrogenase (cytochrome)
MTQSIARVGVMLVAVLGSASVLEAQAPDGAALYKRSCASCHDTGANRAPGRDAFRAMPAERVVAAMETGSMITMANGRTAAERQAIAEFLTGKSLSNPVVTAPARSAMCSTASTAFDANAGPKWAGWGQLARYWLTRPKRPGICLSKLLLLQIRFHQRLRYIQKISLVADRLS